MSSTINTAVDFRFPMPWKDALEQILPAQGSWTDEQYLLLTDHTRLPVEFTDGFVELLPMPSDSHQSILNRLSERNSTPPPCCVGSSTVNAAAARRHPVG